jgi:hypothetical protein
MSTVSQHTASELESGVQLAIVTVPGDHTTTRPHHLMVYLMVHLTIRVTSLPLDLWFKMVFNHSSRPAFAASIVGSRPSQVAILNSPVPLLTVAV